MREEGGKTRRMEGWRGVKMERDSDSGCVQMLAMHTYHAVV